MMMRFKQYHGLPCEAQVFTINGRKAEISDFGISKDIGETTDDEDINRYGCKYLTFKRIPSTSQVLVQYGITEDDYSSICDILEEKLTIGRCGWCV